MGRAFSNPAAGTDPGVGLHTIPQFEDGRDISELNGKRETADREGFDLDPETQSEYTRLIGELNGLTAQVPLETPWTMPNAEELDSITLEDWLRAKTQNETILSLLRLTTRMDFTVDASQMSFLYFLFYVRSGDDYETLNAFEKISRQLSRHAWHLVPGRQQINGSERESVKMLILRGFLRRPHSGSQHLSENQNREICRKSDNSLWKMVLGGRG